MAFLSSPGSQRVFPFFWFNGVADKAAALYTSLFPGSRIINTTHYGPGTPLPAGTVMTVEIELLGMRIIAFNGGPEHTLNESASLVVLCDSQDEIDKYWDGLTRDGGTPIQCGWLKDRFGLCWQIIPANFGELIASPNGAAVMNAMFQMVKLDKAALEAAARG